MADWTEPYNYSTTALELARQREAECQARVSELIPQSTRPGGGGPFIRDLVSAQQIYERTRVQREPGANQLGWRILHGANYGMGPRTIGTPPTPPPVPKGPPVLLETPEIKFTAPLLTAFPRWDRLDQSALSVTGVAPGGATIGFRLRELPDCCATVVASGFGSLHQNDVTWAFLKVLPDLAAKFGYTQVLLSTTEAASVPADSSFKAISECENARTANIVTVFSANTGLSYEDLHPDRDEDED